ncbi:MAG: alkaline phosphatase family protein [Microbacteriaceae bacterium]|nr:alkaline phosphatase family protein [Microbacteriaceae bacterium]
MLPGTATSQVSLAAVMPSGLEALLGRPNSLGLPRVKRMIVFVVDGLGANTILERSGHARTLAGAMTKRSFARSVFPSTTLSALTTITTGRQPGEHGMIGYAEFDPEHDRVVVPLSNWSPQMDPAKWQPLRTIFEQATEFGIASHAIGIERFRNSGFTAASLRGATFWGAETVAGRVQIALELLNTNEPVLIYVYAAEFDHALHEQGRLASKSMHALEELDAGITKLIAGLGPSDGLIVTADHGAVDVPKESQVLFDLNSHLIDGIRHVAGEPRALSLFFEPDASAELRAQTLQSWKAIEGDRALVFSREDAIAAGLFGAVISEHARSKIGEIVVAARKQIAYYDSRTATAQSLSMVGPHGSVSVEETRVPLLQFGAFSQS